MGASESVNSMEPIDPLYDMNNQSVEIDEVEHIRVCHSVKDKPLTEFRYSDVRTLYEVLPKGKMLSCDGPCLGKREAPGMGKYTWIKYSEVIEQVKCISSGLVHKGVESSNQTNIGIYSANRPEWVISEHACYSLSCPVVSLYDSYGKDSIKFILNHAEIKTLFVDNYQRIMNVVNSIDDLPFLKLIVKFDKFDSKQTEELKKYSSKIEIIDFDDLLKIGRENPKEPNPPKPNDVATICYTSGSTGNPKGAIITHGNVIANEAGVFERLDLPHLNFSLEEPKIIQISYLPLAHVLERQSMINAFLKGASIGFMSGNVKHLMDDMKELKPTDMPIVPRLLNKLYDQVKSQVAGNTFKQHLLSYAISVKSADRQKGIYRKDSLYDKLIFQKIREKLGGNVIRIASASAPVSDEVMEFSKAAFGCPIPEGYGQTEATCGVTFSHPFDPTLGHCGPPISCYMIKLVDVPEMGYFSNENKGEICCKGPSTFKGYFKDEEKTSEAIDKDGWLHTGDIGMWLDNGALKIIDRKKNFFKLCHGEYVSPEKLEKVYLNCEFISQIYVDGNSLKDFVIAIVVPDIEYLKKHFKNNEITVEQFCKDEKNKKIILESIGQLGKQSGLMPYEMVKKIHLHPEQMTVDNGLATPTMKIKRYQVRKHFEKIIEQLYE